MTASRSHVALAVLLVGCIQVSDFDPVGGAASISGAWTIDGAPPTAMSCEALGANLVQVTFVDDDRSVVHGALIYVCATTCDETCFDTRPAAVVAEGEWTIRVEAVYGGEVVAVGPATVHVAEMGGHIALAPASFLSGRISAQHVVAGSEPTFETCDAAGIATVEIVFDVAGGDIAAPAVAPCTVGGVGTRVAPGASYTVRLRALDESGAVVRESAPETFVIEPGQHGRLNGGDPFELTAL